ncbi:MAG: ROK family transcriptional regulator [Pseudoclavibacter sp.]
MTETFSGSGGAWLAVPHLSARVSADESASVLVRLIASGAAATRAELVRRTGLARSTVSAGLSTLEAIGLVEVDGIQDRAGRGRPGDNLRVAPGFGLIVALEIDFAGATVALYDFGQRRLARSQVSISLTDGPSVVVRALAEEALSLVREFGGGAPLRAAGIGVSAPVDIRHGMIVGPSFLANWDRFPLEAEFGAALGCIALLRNESGLRGFGVARSVHPGAGSLVYIRIGEGIGAGYVNSDAEMVTGADGAAGEISHMRAGRREGRVCMCGGLDHLATYSSVPAMLGEWRSSSPERRADSLSEFERALRLGDHEATGIAVEAAKEIGGAVAEILLIVNPERIVIGGQILDSCDAILSTIRAVIYDVGLPLSTRNLLITRSELGEDAGIRGGLVLALEASLTADNLAGYRRLAARAQ